MNLILFNVIINLTITRELKISVLDSCVTHGESNLRYQQKPLLSFVKIVRICIIVLVLTFICAIDKTDLFESPTHMTQIMKRCHFEFKVIDTNKYQWRQSI